MKRFIQTLGALVACSGVAFAGPDMVKTSWSNISTNDNAVVTNSVDMTVVNGYFDGVKIDLSGAASPTCTVSVITEPSKGTGESRTLYTKEITADHDVLVRLPAVNTTGTAITNSGEKQRLQGDKLKVYFDTVNKTNINATVYLFIDRK